MLQRIRRMFVEEKSISRPIPILPVMKASHTEQLISAPSSQFIQMVSKKSPTFWVFIHKDIFQSDQLPLYHQLRELFSTNLTQSDRRIMQDMNRSEQIPVFNDAREADKYFKGARKKVVVDENIFEALQHFKDDPEVLEFHLVSPHNVQLARRAIQIPKVKSIYSSYEEVISLIQNQTQKLSTVLIQDLQSDVQVEQNELMKTSQSKRYDLLFPNFMRITQFHKSSLRKYRINMYALRSLSEEDKNSSKKMFAEYIVKLYNKDKNIKNALDNYMGREQSDQWILRQYTKDSFLYRALNSTLRIAEQTEEFFTVGEPFYRVFKAVQKCYREKEKNFFTQNEKKKLKVYRRARLTNEEIEFLKNNIGGYIEVLGFMSTSKNKDIALGFDDKQGNNNKRTHIIEIVLKETKFNNPRFEELDYGYVDLHERNLTVHPEEQQVLINAMNIFKIKDYQLTDRYEYFILEYGAIFDLINKDPGELSPEEKQAYTDYLALEQLGLDINDMGEAYMKTNNWEKARKYFMSKRGRANSIEEESENTFKIAQAYQVGYRIDDALKQYTACLQTLKKNEELQMNEDEGLSLLSVKSKIAQSQIMIDQFEEAQSHISEMDLLLDQAETNSVRSSSSSYLFQRAKLKEELALSKDKQERYQQEKQILKEIEVIYKQLEQNMNDLEIDEQKALLLRQTQLYEKMTALEFKANFTSSEKEITSIKRKFVRKNSELTSYLRAESFEMGVLQRRALQLEAQQYIVSRRKLSSFSTDRVQKQNRLTQTQSIQHDPKRIKKRLLRSLSCGAVSPGALIGDNIKILNTMSQLTREEPIPSQQNYSQSLLDMEQAVRTGIILYDKNDPQRIQLDIQLAQCHKFYKNYDKGLNILSKTSKTEVFHRKQYHTTIAKTYYSMGQLFYEKGQLQNALQSFQRALDIYKKVLKGLFQKSPLRYKVVLEIGVIFLDQMDPQADSLLSEYKGFIEKHKDKNQKNAEIGKSYNVLGLRHLRTKQLEKAEELFRGAIDEMRVYGGQNYIEIGRVLFNLSLTLAFQNRPEEANILITKAENIHKYNITEIKDYEVHPLRAKAYFFQGQVSWIRSEFEESVKYFEKSIEISIKYDKFCRLNEFICRLKIVQCLRGKAKKGLIPLQKYQQYVNELKADLEFDLSSMASFDGVNPVIEKHHKGYSILKALYLLTSDPKIILIK